MRAHHTTCMNTVIRALFFLGILFSFTQAQGAANAPSEALSTDVPTLPVVTIATGDWQPYVDSAMPHFGPMGMVIQTAFARAGYDVVFSVYPWTRNAQFVASGERDAMMPYYCSDERAVQFICSDPIVAGEQVFFYREDMPFDWKTVDDLKDYTIGATLGYFYGQSFDDAEQDGRLSVKRIADDHANLRLLMRGFIDLYPQDRAVGYGMVRAALPKEDWSKIVHNPRPLHSKSLHLLFSRATGQGEALRDIFNRELSAMRDSGELDKLLEPIYADQHAVRGTAPAAPVSAQ